MNKGILIFAFVFVFICGFMGILFASTVLHEYSHMRDMRATGANFSDETIVINIPLELKDMVWESGGVYSTKVNLENLKIANEKMKWTEYKAYTISLLMIAIFFICMMIILMEGVK
jgi:hypothetical protein